MARFDGGWVKIYRKLIEGDIGQNANRFSLFIKLVGWANLKDSTVEWSGKPRVCPRGSLVTSVTQLAEKVGCDKKTIRKQLDYLARRESIRIEKSHDGTFITIPNFEYHQGVQGEDDESMDHSGTIDGPKMVNGMDNGAPHIEERKNLTSKEGTALFAVPTSAEAVLGLYQSKAKSRFEALYPVEGFVEREALKAIQWCENNPKKTPRTARGYKSFFTRWLDKGWEWERKRLPTSSPARGDKVVL